MQQEKSKVEAELQKLKTDTSSRDKQREQLEKYEKAMRIQLFYCKKIRKNYRNQ